jgi:3-ketosteroid 9alpha-monooxygenase subunit B
MRASLAISENPIIVEVMVSPEPILSVARPRRDHGFHRLRVERVVRETNDTVSLVLDVPSDLADTFAYRAGQFCNVRVQGDDMSEMRCYSMSSSPDLAEAMAVTVKRVPGGIVSNWINDHVQAGDMVELSPPTGFFQLTDTEAELVAFAAGSGITPVFSLVKTALATTGRTVRLHYANRQRDSVIFDAELRHLQELHRERLVVEHSYDQEHGLITPATVAAFATGSAGGEFYVCGPGPYLDIVECGLSTLPVEAARIHIERFAPADPPVAATPEAPPSVGAPRVTVELAGRSDTTDHHPGTTILQTARQMGMAPPFSCESGNCATCMARLVEGSVSMFVNNALTAEEVDDGWILTCQSVPTAAEIHVVYDIEGG